MLDAKMSASKTVAQASMVQYSRIQCVTKRAGRSMSQKRMGTA